MPEFNEQEIKSLAARIEALLFVHGEPMTLEKISTLIQVEPEVVSAAIQYLGERLSQEGAGLNLVGDGKKFQLVTAAFAKEAVGSLVKTELVAELTPAALETLAIIAYLGPVPRHKIDYLRGVNTSFMLRNLLVRGLIERESDPDKPGFAKYRLSFESLRHLGLARLEDMPRYLEIKSALESSGRENQDQVEVKVNN